MVLTVLKIKVYVAVKQLELPASEEHNSEKGSIF